MREMVCEMTVPSGEESGQQTVITYEAGPSPADCVQTSSRVASFGCFQGS